MKASAEGVGGTTVATGHGTIPGYDLAEVQRVGGDGGGREAFG